MKLLRAIRFWACAVPATLLVCVFTALGALLVPRTAMQARIGGLWGRVILFGAGVSVRRRGPKPPPGAYVIVPNHTSMLDIPIVAAFVPLDLRFVSRPLFFKLPLLGWTMYIARHVALDPKKPKQAARVLRELGPMFQKGRSLVLFPEGTRTPDGAIQPYRRGPILAAIENQVPILPVRIEGLHESLPRGTLVPKPSRATLTLGQAIETKGLKPPDAKRLAKEIEAWARGVGAEGD